MDEIDDSNINVILKHFTTLTPTFQEFVEEKIRNKVRKYWADKGLTVK